MPLEPETIDMPTLAFLAGVSANEYLLDRLRAAAPQLRNAHGYVIQHLIEGEPTIGEIAERLEVTQQAASKSVLELESQGYVIRIADKVDARVRRVALTRAGRTLVAEGRAARNHLEAKLSAEVGPRAMATTRRVLVALLSHTEGLHAVQTRSAKPPRP